MGKEAALFVSSGSQGNLVALLTHTRPGNEVIVGDKSHIFNAEAASSAIVGGIQLRTLPNGDHGRLDPEAVRSAIRPDDEHFPPTGCVAVENTHNSCGGAVLPPEEIAAVAAEAHDHGIPVHLDGARIFNAAIALGLPASALTSDVDSVTFCLSKGLGAPVGSVLCGSAEFIDRARRWRKILGGGMRQVGVLAAAGLIALDQHIERLAEDHANARRLAAGLAVIPGIDVDPDDVESNMVFGDVAGLGLSVEEFARLLAERGVRIAGVGRSRFRAVTSYEVTADDIDYAVEAAQQVASETLAVGV
jgi:threonine aldolase